MLFLVFALNIFITRREEESSFALALPIEPDVMQRYIDCEGRITLQCKCQGIEEARKGLSSACGIEKDDLRMIMNPTGGAFGYSVNATTFGVMVTAVQNLQMPCTMTLSYEEFMFMTGKRSASFANGKIACDKDGKITAASYDIGLDLGAYAMNGSKIFNNLVSVGFHGYNIPTIAALARGAASNHAFCCPYRGFGSPQIYTTTEALIDMLAEEVGIDAWEFR